MNDLVIKTCLYNKVVTSDDNIGATQYIYLFKKLSVS